MQYKGRELERYLLRVYSYEGTKEPGKRFKGRQIPLQTIDNNVERGGEGAERDEMGRQTLMRRVGSNEAPGKAERQIANTDRRHHR